MGAYHSRSATLSIDRRANLRLRACEDHPGEAVARLHRVQPENRGPPIVHPEAPVSTYAAKIRLDEQEPTNVQ